MKKPNIIYLFTDQQHAGMMSCAGNSYLKTPGMDYIANHGIRFTRAYSPNPVCSPARVSLMTGRFCGAFHDTLGKQARENNGAMQVGELSDEVRSSTLGALMQKSGYELYFGGKEHLPQELRPHKQGFHKFCDEERDILAEKTAEIIKQDHKSPYFMVVSLINPHDICYMAIRDFARTEQSHSIIKNGKLEVETLDRALKIPEGIGEEEFFREHCPPLPNNHEIQEDEAKAIDSLIQERTFRALARAHYTEERWRLHRWAYCRLTELVDKQIQRILQAVQESGEEENTLILFSSDHGDNDGSHHLEHKTTFYEESANVPLIAMWKGHIPQGKVDSTHLISNGLDILPTICDYAGVSGKADPRGLSLRPLLEKDNVSWRTTLGVESEIGRMIVHEKGLKYIKYDAVGIEEQLMDLNQDPGETRHFASALEYSKDLNELRKIYQEEWFPGF